MNILRIHWGRRIDGNVDNLTGGVADINKRNRNKLVGFIFGDELS